MEIIKMAPMSVSIGLAAALTFAASAAQAQDALSPEELLRCEEELASLAPSDEPTPEQAECIALLAQLGVQPAQLPPQAEEGSDS
jgi:hypothetical protein